ncbi:MAG TPA: regulatory iron-sulfur-containing complex subunit RicT [Flavobacterium sp.]|nr:regulatory iron-sulfur-containing complex subunit RicT [Flavobacterium sp.]
MACTGCSTDNGTNPPKGCQSHGSCGTDSCNKLTVFDWLSNMSIVTEPKFDVVEVRFKNSRKEFFRNADNISLNIGDVIATEASSGHDIGVITLTGELVKTQMKKKGAGPKDQLPKVYRKANQKDIDVWTEYRLKEDRIQVRAREMAMYLKLEMKISDVEFQGDGSKVIFYYTASERVDFRQLIKDFAQEFRTKIEMKQIGFRQEASRLGGIGSCGRELCCSTWLTDFRSVNTSAARYQQLSLNPQKLAGQCGKLKCCLNYELDTYIDALKNFPNTDTLLKTEKGDALCQKIDIFKEVMWFAYKENVAHWHVLSTQKVREIVEMNKKGSKAASLEDYAEEIVDHSEKELKDMVGKESLTRFDTPKNNRNNRKKPNRNKTSVKTSAKPNNPVKPTNTANTNKNRPRKNQPRKNED